MIEGVLDASAILAMVNGEPGGSEIYDLLARCAVSAVNLSEIVGKLIDQGATAERALEIVAELTCRVVPFDRQAALAAGALRTTTASHGLSLGDRACLALAQAERAPALTTDRAWSRVDIGVEIRMLR